MGGLQRKKAREQRVILINKMGAGFCISSLYQTDGVENKELNMSGVTGARGGASAAKARPLSPSSGGGR